MPRNKTRRQRLVRRLCPACREPYEADGEEARFLAAHGYEGRRFFRARGCEKCRGTGYRGRLAIHELLSVDADMQRAIAEGVPDFEALTKQAGMTSLAVDGINKAAAGHTSLAEVRRVAYGGL